MYYEFVWNEKVDAGKVLQGSALFPYTENIKDDVLTMRIQFKF